MMKAQLYLGLFSCLKRVHASSQNLRKISARDKSGDCIFNIINYFSVLS